MSGLLERIVRRRRASASSRLGPRTQNGHPSPFEVPYLDGHEAEPSVMHVNGDAGGVEVYEPAEVAEPVEVPAEDELDEPAQIDDESPTMEHRVLVLDEPEDDEALEVEPAPVPANKPKPEPAPVLADEPEPELEPEPADSPAPEPRFRERGRIRRRARYLRRLREVQLRDIGGFMLELHRFGRERADLIEAKIAGAAQTDAELRALHQALAAEEPLRELREAGIGGVCNSCGAVHGSEDRFCATCGEPLGRNPRPPEHSSEFGTFFTQG